jgi:hypothetical protein
MPRGESHRRYNRKREALMPPEEHPVLSLYLFPHLDTFLVADMRPHVPGRPALLYIPWREVLDTPFFQEVEGDFAHLLREGGAYPLAHLLTLPLRVEGVLREAGLKAILRRLGIPPEGSDLPRIGVFLIAGPMVAGRGEALAQAIGDLVHHLHPPAFQREAANALERMAVQEREVLRRLERSHLGRALLGEAPGFYTLWQKPKEKDA